MTFLLPRSPTGHALRVAVAASLCLVLADWFRLEHGSQAVLTAHMVMAQYPYTVYQNGTEIDFKRTAEARKNKASRYFLDD
ncbi:MAG TPA: hypothetical protein VH682_25720, partial [Gemmataceae bacterium]